jgi:hypothetical protein
MTRKSRDKHLSFELHHCRGWKQPEDLLESLKLAIHLSYLIPLENKMIEVGERKLARPVVKDLQSWFDQNYRFEEKWDENEFNPFYSKERIGGFLRIPLNEAWSTDEPVSGAISIGFSAESFGETYNIVEFSCTLFGKSLAFPDSQLHWIDNVLARFLKFAKPIIQQLKPAYALITDTYYRETYGREVLAGKLKFIHWCNYFGPTYVQKYSEDIFLSAPGWRVERLGEGIWYQTTEHFADSKEKSLQEEILAHFKPIGVKQVV